ncbi:MAG TPA: hypothetical protein VFS23_37865 [Vicinamibacterales bacterium]|nr:hypothetical protein [Vicinamibacterales bacterium]
MADYETFAPAPFTFVVMPLVLVGLLAWGTAEAWNRSGVGRAAARRVAILTATAGAGWMALTWTTARSGILREWDRNPPPLMFLVVAIVTLAVVIAHSRLGTRIVATIPLWVLVLVQAFRLPLELAMHGMYERGIMPVQLSYSGLNFDIITGITAILVAFLTATRRAGPMVVAGWNLLGLALLINVVTVAILATPRFRYFGDDHLNIWVTYPPFVWLPAVMVLAALAGHLLIFRALLRTRAQRSTAIGRAQTN